ncbi:Protein ELYS [Grifola frondosa]|uniref:Protein ELYS n=1 Tax=Grifola frondosa TaxID=5627 RepID=A0A1C7LTA6_GRIFR|nr:Protein ELYS [Grifola frondosa]
MLIFDILLSSGGIYHTDALYPPTDVASLQRLLDAITNSSYDVLKQDTLVYFLLKWHQDGREEQFKDSRCIPPQFVALADAYWHLDSGINISRAVALLSDARLNREYTSKVLQALSLAADPYPLIRKYVRTAKPQLTEPDDIDTYTIALADSRLMEAWQFQRTFPSTSPTRPRLLRKIIDWCLTPKPRATPLKDLLALPFSDYEQSLLHTYALEPPAHLPPTSISIIQDLVCLRLVQSGKHAEAVKLDRQFAVVSVGGRVSERSQKAAQERRQMLDELVAVMPAAERELLQLELELLSQGKGMAGAPAPREHRIPRVSSGSDLSTSWDVVRSPPAITHRAGAPRFGGPIPDAGSTSIDEMFPAITAAPRPRRQPLRAQSTVIFSPPRPTRPSPQKPGPSAPKSPAAQPRAQAAIDDGSSLFEFAGSANTTANAFYKPSATAGVKRPFGEDGPRTPASPPSPPADKRPSPPPSPAPAVPTETPIDADVSMHVDEEDVAAERGEPSRGVGDRSVFDDAGVSAEFSVSVFSAPVDVGKRHLARTETQLKMPPGAFIESDDENGHEHDHPPEPRAPPPQSPPPQSPPRRVAQVPVHTRRTPSPPPPRTTRTQKSKSQTLPGTLIDEEEEQDDDVVPPLPPITASRRPARKSRATKVADEASTPLRRSTRISAVSSIGSSSPEPPSPKLSTKPRKSGRTSNTSTAGAAKGGARRKRS